MHREHHARRRRGVTRRVGRRECHREHLTVACRQHGAGGRHVLEGARHARRCIQLCRPERRAVDDICRSRPRDHGDRPSGRLDLNRRKVPHVIGWSRVVELHVHAGGWNRAVEFLEPERVTVGSEVLGAPASGCRPPFATRRHSSRCRRRTRAIRPARLSTTRRAVRPVRSRCPSRRCLPRR